MKQLRGRNALLTGGSRGLGAHIARELAACGVNVALAARDEDRLRAVADEARRAGVRAEVLPVDLADDAARDALIDRATDALGPLDILINNAGIEWIYSYVKLSPQEIEQMVRVNLLAAMLLARRVLPGMIERRRGHVINMASLAGKRGNPYSATYGATKAALIEFTRALRAELDGTGVSASAICPGYVVDEGMFADLRIRTPLIAGGSKPEPVAAAVIRALREDLDEVIVNPGPVRLMLAVNAISPRLAGLAYRAVHAMYRREAARNERGERESTAK